MSDGQNRRVMVRTPATSANLGPGFDAFGLALAWHDEVTAEVTEGGLEVEVTGVAAGRVPRDERHLIVRAMRATFERLGGQPPGLRLSCRNSIPHGRGLGSSAAAICAGVLAANALAAAVGGKSLDADELLDVAAGLEGHPDNVAACLLGNLTIAWSTPGAGEDGATRMAYRAVSLAPVADVVPVVFVPGTPLSTEVARGLLPAAVPHADAAFTAGRAGLLVAALTAPMPSAERAELLLEATEDRLHQHYRAPAMPESAELIARLRAAGVAAVVSGAGPTVLAFTVPAAGAPEIPARGNALDALCVEVVGEGWETRRPSVAASGVEVVQTTRTNSSDPGRGESTKEC